MPLRNTVTLKPFPYVFALEIRTRFPSRRFEVHPIGTSELQALNFLEEVLFDGFRKLSGGHR